MSFWKSISDFVNEVLHKDDDYPLCLHTYKDCSGCPKINTCKKAFHPDENVILESTLDKIKELNNTDNQTPFKIESNQTCCKISFGTNCFIQLNLDGTIILKGTTIRADGEFETTSGADGVLCLATLGLVSKGIVRGIG